jgi:hypothetical protein
MRISQLKSSRAISVHPVVHTLPSHVEYSILLPLRSCLGTNTPSKSSEKQPGKAGLSKSLKTKSFLFRQRNTDTGRATQKFPSRRYKSTSLAWLQPHLMAHFSPRIYCSIGWYEQTGVMGPHPREKWIVLAWPLRNTPASRDDRRFAGRAPLHAMLYDDAKWECDLGAARYLLRHLTILIQTSATPSLHRIKSERLTFRRL